MFAAVLIIGTLGVLCWNFGLQNYFIAIFIIAIILNEAEAALKKKEYKQALDQYKDMVHKNKWTEITPKERDEKSEKALKDASTESFAERKMIPVRIDKETGAYVICVDELLQAIDKYYTQAISEYFKSIDDTDNNDTEKDDEDK